MTNYLLVNISSSSFIFLGTDKQALIMWVTPTWCKYSKIFFPFQYSKTSETMPADFLHVGLLNLVNIAQYFLPVFTFFSK